VPQFAYLERLNKPPLIYWATAASYRLLGVSEASARVVPALAALLGVLVLFQLGRSMFGRRGGWATALVALGTLGYVILGRVIITDMVLCFWMTLTFASLWWAVHSRRWSHYLLFFFGAAGSMLTKGPVGLALPGLVGVLYLTLTRQRKAVRWPAVAAGVALYAGLSFPWFAALQAKYPNFLNYMFLSENVARFAGKYHNDQPLYFYVPVVLLGMGLWSVPLFAAAAQDFRRFRKDGVRSESTAAPLFLWLWFLVVFAFFSASKAKLYTYVLPCFPALTLLVGKEWADALGAQGEALIGAARRRQGLLTTVLLAALGVAALVYGWVGQTPSPELRIPAGLTLGMALLVGAAAGVWGLARRTGRALFLGTALGAVLLTAGVVQAAQIVLIGEDIAPFARDVAAQIRPEERVVLFRADRMTAFFFYFGRALGSARRVESLPALERQDIYGNAEDQESDRSFRSASRELLEIAESGKGLYCVLRKDDYKKLRSRLAAAGCDHVLEQNRQFMLITNQSER
jgi:4-amino-4-deoxy-L-arabinose transferase-like glycosyltransferase